MESYFPAVPCSSDMIEVQIQRFFGKTLSSAIANISIDMFDTNDDFEVHLASLFIFFNINWCICVTLFM